jgi:gp32 DNA binding protein like
MSISIADLRKSRSSDFSVLTKALTKTADVKQDDSDFFKLEKDKAGNASAVIRFLPKHPDDELPFVTVYSHAFQGPTGRWFIENSRTTIGEADPVSEANRALWSTGNEKDKKQAQAQKRKTSYIANVLVISDPKHPENEGKVMRFKFGKKIFEKIKDKAEPTFEDENPVNVFDAFDGAEFKLRMRQVDGYPNYDTSVFSDPTPIAESDEEILAIVNQMKPLKEFVDPKMFKSYDELKKKFESVMSAAVASSERAEQVAEKMREEAVAQPKPVGKVVKEKIEDSPPWDSSSSEEDDIESYFASIAKN